MANINRGLALKAVDNFLASKGATANISPLQMGYCLTTKAPGRLLIGHTATQWSVTVDDGEGRTISAAEIRRGSSTKEERSMERAFALATELCRQQSVQQAETFVQSLGGSVLGL